MTYAVRVIQPTWCVCVSAGVYIWQPGRLLFHTHTNIDTEVCIDDSPFLFAVKVLNFLTRELTIVLNVIEFLLKFISL